MFILGYMKPVNWHERQILCCCDTVCMVIVKGISLKRCRTTFPNFSWYRAPTINISGAAAPFSTFLVPRTPYEVFWCRKAPVKFSVAATPLSNFIVLRAPLKVSVAADPLKCPVTKDPLSSFLLPRTPSQVFCCHVPPLKFFYCRGPPLNFCGAAEPFPTFMVPWSPSPKLFHTFH